MDLALGLVLAAVLLAAAGLKAARPRRSADALAVYGIDRPEVRAAVLGATILAEVVLAAGVALGRDAAAWLAAAMMLMFAAVMVGAIVRGQAGRSCACFGANSTLGWTGVGRNLALAAGFAAIPFLPEGTLTIEQWLVAGVGLALVAVAALAVAVLALAREIGELRLRMGPTMDSALEVPGEGPEAGARIDWPLGWQSPEPPAGSGAEGRDRPYRLAVFISEGCHVCKALRPSIEAFLRDPMLDAQLFDEVDDADAWRAFQAPGSPYAVAMSGDMTVLAKGSFNTVPQLESILAAAERRSRPAPRP